MKCVMPLWRYKRIKGVKIEDQCCGTSVTAIGTRRKILSRMIVESLSERLQTIILDRLVSWHFFLGFSGIVAKSFTALLPRQCAPASYYRACWTIFEKKNTINLLSLLPYFPDIVPCDFFLIS